MYTFYYWAFTVLQYLFLAAAVAACLLMFTPDKSGLVPWWFWLDGALVSVFLAGASFIGQKQIQKLYDQSLADEEI